MNARRIAPLSIAAQLGTLAMTLFLSRFPVRLAGAFALTAASVAVPVSVLMAQDIPVVAGAMPSEDMIVLAPDGLEKALAALPALVTATLERSGIPGAAVAVVHGGETVFAQGFGVREIGKPEPVDADTVFQIASLSKPISGTVAAIQVSAGVVDWDDPAVRHLPGLRLSDDYVTSHATIGDFFAHRSGLPMAAGDELEDIGYDRDQVIERLRMVPLDAFRTSYHYANFGITIGAEAVAAASGTDWEALAEKALFAPLGMTATSFRHADFTSRSNRATLHIYEDGSFAPLYARNPDAQAPAGGASSSANDLAEWLKLLLAGGRHGDAELIGGPALAAMLRAQGFSAPASSPDTRSGFYGFGFNVGVQANGRTFMGHSGAFVLGGSANMMMVPSADTAIVVITNGGPVGVAEAITTQFMDHVQFGEATRDWYAFIHPRMVAYYEPVGDLAGGERPAEPAPSRALEDYAGDYDSAYFGPARIELADGSLSLVLGPDDVRLPMTHWNGDSFAVFPRNENAPFGSASSLTFVVEDGKVARFTLDYLDELGLATWAR